MSLDPGAIAAPTNEMMDVPTSNGFRAWKVSDAEDIKGHITAWTSESELGTHVSAGELLRLVPM